MFLCGKNPGLGKYMFETDFTFTEPFTLESGEVLHDVNLRYTIYGELNADRSNAILIFHALTGSSRISDWWAELLGDGLALDTSEFAFICVNYLGSCYGSTSARSLKTTGDEIPLVTLRDMLTANSRLIEHLGIRKFRAVIGGSVGGMLALQFAVEFPQMTDKVVAIGATPLSAMGLALNHLQRHALDKDDIELARKIAVISYKAAGQFDTRFGRKPNRNGENPKANRNDRFDIGGYLDHQGDAFRERFEIESYDLISKAMDLFDLTDEDINSIDAKVALVGISSDWLFPATDVRRLTRRFQQNGVDAAYFEIESDDGHDAFLSDPAEMSRVLVEILGVRAPLPETHFLAKIETELRVAGCYK